MVYMEENETSMDKNKDSKDTSKPLLSSENPSSDDTNQKRAALRYGAHVTIDATEADFDFQSDSQKKTMDTENDRFAIFSIIEDFMRMHYETFLLALKMAFLIGYFVYFGFAMAHHVGDEGSWRLIVCTILGVYLIIWNLFKHSRFFDRFERILFAVLNSYSTGKRSLIIRWILYVGMSCFMIIYVVVFVALRSPENLRSLIGLAVYPLLLFLYSNNKRKVNWHTIFWAMAIQFIMALIILKTTLGASVIRWCGTRLEEFMSVADAGSLFLFGVSYMDHSFVFSAMVKVLVLIVAMSVLTYLGVIEFMVETVGRLLAFVLDISPPEGINSVGSIFLHVPESVLLIQQYLPDMTPSQLFVTYAGGLATVGGASLIMFMASGIPAAPLLAASAMSAPAALATAKLAFPSVEDEEIPRPPKNTIMPGQEQRQLIRKATSFMDSIILGINQSVVIFAQVVFYILTFVIILEFLNRTSVWFGDRIGVENMTIEFILSYVFYPFAWLMGTREEDCLFVGQILGIRTFSLAVVAYPYLGQVMVNGANFREYVAASANNTWEYSGNDIILHTTNRTLVGGVIDARSEIIATYSLCGSASFAIMGLIIGSFEAIVPHRIGEITTYVFRSLVCGTVASYLTACFAGLLYEESIGIA